MGLHKALIKFSPFTTCRFYHVNSKLSEREQSNLSRPIQTSCKEDLLYIFVLIASRLTAMTTYSFPQIFFSVGAHSLSHVLYFPAAVCVCINISDSLQLTVLPAHLSLKESHVKMDFFFPALTLSSYALPLQSRAAWINEGILPLSCSPKSRSLPSIQCRERFCVRRKPDISP